MSAAARLAVPALALALAAPAQAACPAAGPYPAPWPTRPRYTLDLRVTPSKRLVVGRETVVFTPNRPTSRLVFRLWPNGPYEAGRGTKLTAGAVDSAGRRLRSRLLDPTTLVVSLGRILRPGRPVAATVSWRLIVGPSQGLSRLGDVDGTIRLGAFFPILAWNPRSGWITDPPSRGPAETFTSPVADFDVRIRAPAGLTVLATGTRVAATRWRARAVRDFALAVGRFTLVHGTARAPRPVRVTVGVQQGLDASEGKRYLARAAHALEQYSRRFGPYPWTTFSLPVMSDLGSSGIEYPTIVFEGPGSLDRATAHETAHQWFYSLIGNNQARDPWLDESLATWASTEFDGSMPFYKTLPIPPAARGHLGAPMRYWDQHSTVYFAGVYAQGAQALDALGDVKTVDCALRLYVARNAYGIAAPSDLIGALARVIPTARTVLARFGAV
jgi:hypothetical protein